MKQVHLLSAALLMSTLSTSAVAITVPFGKTISDIKQGNSQQVISPQTSQPQSSEQDKSQIEPPKNIETQTLTIDPRKLQPMSPQAILEEKKAEKAIDSKIALAYKPEKEVKPTKKEISKHISQELNSGAILAADHQPGYCPDDTSNIEKAVCDQKRKNGTP